MCGVRWAAGHALFGGVFMKFMEVLERAAVSVSLNLYVGRQDIRGVCNA